MQLEPGRVEQAGDLLHDGAVGGPEHLGLVEERLTGRAAQCVGFGLVDGETEIRASAESAIRPAATSAFCSEPFSSPRSASPASAPTAGTRLRSSEMPCPSGSRLTRSSAMNPAVARPSAAASG